MDGSSANQVLAQMHLWVARFSDLSLSDRTANLWLRILPKKLDEKVAADMVAGFGGVITKLNTTEAGYMNVLSEDLFKPESYKC